MKKTTLLAVLLAISATGFSAAPRFTITGKFSSNENDGKELILRKGTDDIVQKCIVRGDLFSFSGKADPHSIYGVTQAIDGTSRFKTLAFVVPEQGDITLVQQKKGGMQQGGTPLNDQLREYHVVSDSLNSNIYRRKNMFDKEKDSVKKATYAMLLAQSRQEAREFKMQSLNTLNTNIVLAYVVLDLTKDNFTKKQIDSVMKASPYKKILNFDPLQQFYDRNSYKSGTDIGDKFKDIKLSNRSGKMVKLSDYVGKGAYVLVDFWASWCKPCIGEIPNLKNLYKQYSDKGLVILSIGVWDEDSKVFAMARGLGLPWVQLYDYNSYTRAPNSSTELYGIKSIPHIILFAPDGTIMYRNLRGSEIDRKLKELF